MHATPLVNDTMTVRVWASNVPGVPNAHKKTEPTTFGLYLDQLMTENGFGTAADLARASGTSESTISRWRAGLTKHITIEQLRAVAPHLGVRIGDLLIQAGLATPAELGTVGAPPPPRAPLPPVLQGILARLFNPKISESHKATLLEGIERTVRTWDEMRSPTKEPQMRKRT